MVMAACAQNGTPVVAVGNFSGPGYTVIFRPWRSGHSALKPGRHSVTPLTFRWAGAWALGLSPSFVLGGSCEKVLG